MSPTFKGLSGRRRQIKMTEYPTEENKSQFNAGIAKLKRIDICKQRVHDARLSNDFGAWKESLCSWREEMAERMNKKEDLEADKKENKIDAFVGSKHKGVIYELLKRYGIFLSRIEYKYGYSMPDKEGAGTALK